MKEAPEATAKRPLPYRLSCWMNGRECSLIIYLSEGAEILEQDYKKISLEFDGVLRDWVKNEGLEGEPLEITLTIVPE